MQSFTTSPEESRLCSLRGRVIGSSPLSLFHLQMVERGKAFHIWFGGYLINQQMLRSRTAMTDLDKHAISRQKNSVLEGKELSRGAERKLILVLQS